MKKIGFILLLSFGFQYMNAQGGDFIFLKKKGKTIASFHAGNNINITTTKGNYIEAVIDRIYNDTLFLKEYMIRQIPTTLGVFVLDTVTSYPYKYHYNEILAIGKTGRRFNWSASASSLLSGGVLLTLGSGIVYLIDKDRFSPQLLIAGVALGITGYIIGKKSNNGNMVIGKKYHLVYVGTGKK
jgi:hypothetical protein